MIKTEELKCERSEFYNELLKDKTDIFTEFGKEMYSSIYVEDNRYGAGGYSLYPLYKMVVFFNNKTKNNVINIKFNILIILSLLNFFSFSFFIISLLYFYLL